MRLVSSISGVGVGGVGSEMDTAEMCAGREDSDEVAWCFGGINEDEGPL
jgi:hypothetical protein